MSKGTHNYVTHLLWTGNTGSGTAGYEGYERSFQWQVSGKPLIQGSSDPAFRGDASKYNPEELLVASLSSCHMLWYLHLCAENQIILTGYADDAIGTMTSEKFIQGVLTAGKFQRVLLQPVVTLLNPSDLPKARALHHEAHHRCFISASVNFPVDIEEHFE